MTIKELKQYFLDQSLEAQKEESEEEVEETYLRGMKAGQEIAFYAAAQALDLLDEKS